MSDIEIEIDGKKILTQPNRMIIQVADEVGSYIPRFCYHKHLSIAANCRMCLVEVEKSPKALPACATPITPGMKVFTRSAKALAAQRAVMEFLLINHPLDCPICDQGGECELQDLSLGYGRADSYYVEGKRSVKDEDLGPLIATEMTRCIHCTRCVRFGDEIAGVRELGLIGRGESTEISTYVHQAMRSEVSGNIIDLCPVGALTSKPFRFSARAWELQQAPTISPHDCLGSFLNVHTREGKVMRVVPRENKHINQTWISDRDRFSYEGLYHPDRLTRPMIRTPEGWQETDWQTALEAAALGIQQVIQAEGALQLGALASPQATIEEMYLLQKLCRALGSSNVDHRLRQSDFKDQAEMPAFPGCAALSHLQSAEVIFLIGSNIQKEQPIAALKVREAARSGAHIIALNMMDYTFNFPLIEKKIIAPHEMVSALQAILSSLQNNEDNAFAAILKKGKSIQLLLGALAFNHPQASFIRSLTQQIAAELNATVGLLTEGPNTAGAWLAGMIPHRGAAGEKTTEGLHARAMFHLNRQGYIFLNVEPELDCVNVNTLQQALSKASCVVALSLYKNAMLLDYATVMLPMAAWTETSGTFVNACGEWQSFQGVAKPIGDARPAWKILRVLANLLALPSFDYQTSEEVRDELKTKTASYQKQAAYSFNAEKRETQIQGLSRIGEIPLYATDSIVRHADALQAAQEMMEGNQACVRLHPETAQALKVSSQEWVKVKQGTQQISLQVIVDARVPKAAAYIAGGLSETAGLPELFGKIEIEKM